jgi:ABC-type multidrug transport system fused ATPase/permease subunit
MKSLQALARLGREAARYPSRLALAIASLLGLGAAQLTLPWMVKRWVEGPLSHGVGVQVGSTVAAAAVAVAAVAVFLFVSRGLLASVNQRMLERLRNDAVARIVQAEPATVRGYPTGDLMSRVFQDAGMLSGFVENVLKRFLGDGVLAVGALVMMVLLHARLALATCVLAPLIGVLLATLGGVIRRWGSVAQQSMGDLGAVLHEQLQGFTTIKGYQREAFEAAKFAEHDRHYRQRAVMADVWTALLVALVFAAAAGGFILAIWYGSHEVTAGRITAGGLLAFCLYAGQTVEPLRRLADLHGLLQRSLAAAERLFEVLELPVPEPSAMAAAGGGEETHRRAARHSCAAAGVSWEAVRFRYHATQPLLEGLDLAIDAGERVALVGASGAGKSTLARLLVRFQEPREGRILIDGRDIATLPRELVRRRVCVVEQEPFLFSGSLADNLRYGRPAAPVAAVEKAVALTGLEPLWTARPEGLAALYAEAGRDVSGGQRQRVALARAIVRNPDVLVLDEATSALDSESEAQIFADLETWFALRTVLIVAHRLSTIRRVPRIVVLDQGRIVADGAFSALLEGSEAFRTLFAEQLAAAGVRGIVPDSKSAATRAVSGLTKSRPGW